MEKMKSFKNASFLMAGGACLLMLVGHLINKTVSYPYSDPLVSGLGHLLGLCIPVLCLWFGLSLRMWLKNPKWWLQALLLCFTAFCLYKYRHDLFAYWKAFPYLYSALICLGYLVPRRMICAARRNRGWEYLVFMLLAAFCYTAANVVESRLEWLTGSYLPEHHDMLRLMLTLMKDAEPLMAILTLYFVLLFSFSRAGQWLGERDWFRGIVIVPAVYLFFISVSNLFFRAGWTAFISFLVQPVTVCLVFIIVRLVGRYWKKHGRV